MVAVGRNEADGKVNFSLDFDEPGEYNYTWDGGSKVDSPNTSDDFNILLWSGLALIAVAGVGVTLILYRKKRNNH